MVEDTQASRREFLTTGAKVAALVGLTAGVGCAATRYKTPEAIAGPTPRPIEPDAKIRLGFVGTGGRGTGLVRSFMLNDNLSVKAIAELHPERTQEPLRMIKEKTGDTPELYHGEEDYKKLMARDDIDAVVLATPGYLHGRMYLDCFAAGKHFYGEKPLTLEVGEANALVTAQQKNPQVVAQIGFQRRAMSFFRKSVQAIRDGAVGELINGRGCYVNTMGPFALPDAPNAWFARRRFSGDWMLDQACHTWDVFNWATGALPVTASGMGRKDLFLKEDPQRDVTDMYIAHLEYPNKVLISWEHNWIGAFHDKYAESDIGRFTGVYERLTGTKAAIDMGDAKIFPRKESEKVIELCPGERKSNAPDQAIKEFLQCLRTGQAPVCGVVDARKATLTGLLVRQAVDENRRVLMTEIL